MRRVTSGAIVAIVLGALLGCGSGDDGPVVVFDGQSLNRVPKPDFPARAVDGLDVEAENIAINGASWTDLAPSVTTRRDKYADDGFAILVMVGGTSDVASGDDGPTIHREMVDYAESARAAGFRFIIATTIQPAYGESAARDAARKEANRLLLEDDDAFDAVVDLAAVPGLDDPTGDAYVDEIGHPSATGAQLMADAVRPAIEEGLEEADGLL